MQELIDELKKINAKYNEPGLTDLISDLEGEMQHNLDCDLASGHEPLTKAEYATVWNKTDARVV